MKSSVNPLLIGRTGAGGLHVSTGPTARGTASSLTDEAGTWLSNMVVLRSRVGLQQDGGTPLELRPWSWLVHDALNLNRFAVPLCERVHL